MASLSHEGLLDLFRNRPQLAPELLRDALHASLPPFDHAAVATWASRPIETGHAGFALTPHVLGPLSVPIVRDQAEAARDPELAVLSALVHGSAPDSVEIGKAALVAARGLDDARAALYIDLVLASANEAARNILRALMASKTYEYQSDFAKEYVAKGRAEGEAQGRARAILDFLRVRGIDVPAEVRERVLSSTDAALLDAWLERAVTAKSVEDVIRE